MNIRLDELSKAYTKIIIELLGRRDFPLHRPSTATELCNREESIIMHYHKDSFFRVEVDTTVEHLMESLNFMVEKENV